MVRFICCISIGHSTLLIAFLLPLKQPQSTPLPLPSTYFQCMPEADLVQRMKLCWSRCTLIREHECSLGSLSSMYMFLYMHMRCRQNLFQIF